MKKLLLIGIILGLVGCNDEAPSIKTITEQLKNTGVDIRNIQEPTRNPKALLPNSYKEHLTFEVPDVAPNGGQIFVCDKKEYCDAIMSYFKGISVVLVGPYLIQSPNGLVVGQFNSGLTPQVADKLVAVIKSY